MVKVMRIGMAADIIACNKQSAFAAQIAGIFELEDLSANFQFGSGVDYLQRQKQTTIRRFG